MESILTSIKKLLGVTEEYTHYDADIIMHINTVFGTLAQLGVGPSEGFRIEDETTEWTEFIPGNSLLYESVKSYMFLKVKLLFDPPLSGTVLQSYDRQISELEWRLNVTADPGKSE